MPPQKNQHYVPKFYLKNFSTDGINLNLYVINKKEHVTGSLNNQCSKSYFYSNDTMLEKLISQLESREASAINKLIRERKLSALSEEEYFVKILEFISMMNGRTLNNKKQTEKMIDNFMEDIIKPMFRADPLSKGISDEDIAKMKMKWPTLHLLGIQIGVRAGILLSDLIPVLLVNNTKSEFIISDNPVVFYNRAFHKMKGVSMSGYTAPGLMIFCPLNPNLMLMLFHAPYYKIKMSKHHKVSMREKDVREINKLQLYNGYNSVIYRTKKQKEKIDQLHNETGDIPNKPFTEANTEFWKGYGGEVKEIYHTTNGKIPFELNLKFIKAKPLGKGSVGFVRNKELYEAFEALSPELMSIKNGNK